MFIKLNPATTPGQAIQMAYEFASALRATGWPPEDIAYAQALWVGTEYSGSTLLAYLEAGFDAGYLGKPMPTVVAAQDTNRHHAVERSKDPAGDVTFGRTEIPETRPRAI